jgi:uncharacterized membrane protein
VFAGGGLSAQDIAVEGATVTLNCPGATLTAAADINDSGTIVGRCTVAGRTVGFIYERGENGEEGTYTTFEFPDAARTEAWGINERGDVIGQYVPPGETRLRGFIRSAAGEYVTLDLPGDFNVMPEDINDAGFAVGCLHNSGTMHGWISKGTEPVSISPAYEMYTDVNESGTVVGWSWPTPVGGSFSFVQSGLGRTEFRYPGASNTQAWGLNQYGDVVGWFGPTSGGTGFRLRGGQFATIALAGAAWTRAFGVNSAGQIVGAYRAGTATRGFLLVPSE